MSNPKLSFALCLYVTASVTALGQNQGVGYLFQFATPPNSSQQFIGYVANANPLSPVVNANGPSGIAQVIPKPDGSKFYLIGSSGASSLQSADPTFTHFNSINGLTAAPTAAAITRDGKYLLVGGTDDALYFIDTSTDQIVGQSILLPGAPNFATDTTGYCTACWITFSLDSQTAYVITNSAFGSQITAINVTTRQKIGTSYTLPFGGATSLAMSPLGVLYATAVNRIYVVDPVKVIVTQEIDLAFEPAMLQFDSAGTFAYAINRSPSIGGKSILQLNLSNGNFAYWPSQPNSTQPTTFDGLFIASNNRLFAYSAALGYLFDVTTSPFAAAPSTSLSIPSADVQNVLAVAVSNEVPSARYLFLLVGNGNQTLLLRINLATNQIDPGSGGLAGLNTGIMEYTVVPPETGVSGFLQFNNLQNVAAGAVSAPLLVRVLNQLGQPVYNVPVTYSTDPTNGTVITAPTQTTNADGYAQTTITAPTTAGTYTITVTAGTVSTTFTFTVPCTGTGCTGGGGPSSPLVSIVSGDGQLLQLFNPPLIDDPLTILVVDATGKPQVNVPVTFQVTAGIGSLSNPTTTTDANGHASTEFTVQSLGPNSSLQANTITATTPAGTVNFTETTFQVNTDQTGFPDVELITPTVDSGLTITLTEGAALPNAIVATAFSGVTFGNPVPTPIPNVSIFTQNGSDFTQPPAASCLGSSNSDSTGTAHCTLVAACQTGTFPLTIVIGNYKVHAATVHISGGVASQIAISSGNNQTGSTGGVLQPLIANVTDGCGNPIAGAQVTWTVTQGSATLLRTVNTSTSNGQVTTGIVFGQTPGPVVVKLSLGTTASVTFTLTNQVVVASITASGGTGQMAPSGAAFPQPVKFLVKDANGNPLSGIQVTFNVAGPGTVNPTSANTDTSGQASTTVTAGSTSGTITVTATAGVFTASVTLTVQAPGPAITAASFQNSASFAAGLVPCGLGTIVGNGIAPSISGVVSGLSNFGPMSYQVAGFSMTVNGVPAPISSVSNESGIQQATFQTPCEAGTGSATVVVTVNGSNTTVTGVQVLPAQPGIFTYQGPSGKAYGAVIRALDGSYVTPASPAHRGETYYLVVTGLGQTTPATTTNNAGIANQNVNAQVVVGVNNAGVAVTSAQYAVGLIGVYFVGFQIPLTNPTGTDLPLAIGTIVNGQVTYGNSVFLPGVI